MAKNNNQKKDNNSSIKTTTLDIGGMHCASCSTIINGALDKTKGVKSANVNLAIEKAMIEYDENIIDEKGLIDVVEKKGFKAKVAKKTENTSEKDEPKTKGIFTENKIGLVIALIVLIIGVGLYFYFDPEGGAGGMNNKKMADLDSQMFLDMKIKTVHTDEGTIKLFALAKSNDLSKINVAEGNSIPEDDSMVIGFKEANMMKEEKLFEKSGDTLNDLFGMKIVAIEGILNETGTIVDDMHFVAKENYDVIEGEENVVYIKLNNENMSKVFYYYDVSSTPKLKFELSEGDLKDYKTVDIDGKTYYPIIIGSNEANMMREEKLITNIGDNIDGFFGKNVIVVGVLKQTNTSLDMMHLIPLKENELV